MKEGSEKKGGSGGRIDLAVIAICSILIIESYALYLGIDGTALSLSIGAISGLGGYCIRKGMERPLETRSYTAKGKHTHGK